MNINPEQMLELARIVTGYRFVAVNGGLYRLFPAVNEVSGASYEHHMYPLGEWNPSLTGEDWQVAQACRVIVAAASLPTFKAIHKNTQGNFVVERRVDNYPEWDGYTPDIFEASAKALIASRGRGEQRYRGQNLV